MQIATWIAVAMGILLVTQFSPKQGSRLYVAIGLALIPPLATYMRFVARVPRVRNILGALSLIAVVACWAQSIRTYSWLQETYIERLAALESAQPGTAW
jgi:hypothetical protein